MEESGMRERWLVDRCSGHKSSPGSLQGAPPTPCSGPLLRRQVDRRAEIHLVRGLAGEGRMGHVGVVLVDEEFHEAAELFNRVEGVEVKPLVLQGTPERL